MRHGRLKALLLAGIFGIFLAVPTATKAQTTSQGSNGSSSQESPQTPTRNGTIEGTVFDPGNRIFPGVQVVLRSGLTQLGERETDGQGKFKFEGLLDGEYEIVSVREGFSGSVAQIFLKPGEIRVADLHLSLNAVEQQVVVSAEPGGVLAPEIGTSTSVVTQQEIEDRGNQTVYDAMRGLPGVEINQTGRRGAVTSAFIRGGDSDYNLVMIDGIPLNDFGGGFGFAPLPADGVQQVEVLRGPQSALYGSNAVAGVVNVVTEHGDGPPQFSFLAEGGSFYTRRFATTGAGLTGGFSWAYSLSRLDTNGMVANDNYWNQTATVSLGYSRAERRQFNVYFFGDAGDAGSPGPFGSDPDHLFPGTDTVSRLRQNLYGYQANYSEQINRRFRQVCTVSVSEDRFVDISPFGDSFTKNLRVVANTRSEITISQKDLLVAGFEFDHETFQDSFVMNPNGVPFVLPRNNYAFFVENRWNPGKRWFVSTGLRVDDIQTGSLQPDPTAPRPFIPASAIVEVDPRIAAAFLAHESDSGKLFGFTRIHGSFGTGIRPPNGFELGFTDNPALKPERSISFDGGVEQAMANDRLVLNTTFFYNQFRDQIVDTGGNNIFMFSSENVAKSRAYGLENSLRIRPLRSLEISGSYTWLNTAILALNGTDAAQVPFTVGEPLIRRPHNTAGWNITWRRDRLMLNTFGVVRGAVLDLEPNDGAFACEMTPPLPCLFRNHGYVNANAGFSYQLPHGVEIYGHLNNFLNQRYEESFGFPSLRLNFMAGMKFRIGAD
jgi:outer membrane receptor protein involved in Fe transport